MEGGENVMFPKISYLNRGSMFDFMCGNKSGIES